MTDRGPRVLPVLVVALAVSVGLVAAQGLPASADGPFDDSRRAAGDLSFTGVVRLDWTDGAGTHRQRFKVKAASGSLLLLGPHDLFARDRARLIHHDGDWSLLWPAELDPLRRPALAAKYRTSYAQGVPVVGRATQLVEFRRDGRLWERLFVDRTSHLILRREHFGEDGTLRRTVTFEQLAEGAPTTMGSPPRVADHSPDTVPGMRVSSPFRAPVALGVGYRRVGTYRDGSTVQVLYSDGVYGLSIFEQRGALRRSSVPPGAHRVDVGERTGWTVSWAGGEIVMWQGGDAVYTAVGDGPLDDVLEAAAGLPSAGRPSVLDRLRRTVSTTLRAFTLR